MFNGKKVAFVFPGQGAQYVGMAADFLSADPELKKSAQNFSQKAGFDLLELMSEGPSQKLAQTQYTQPSILLHSLAALRALQKELDLKPDMVAGHSLGEFSALVASGVLSLEDALYLVHQRGLFMTKAGEGSDGGMCAIIGMSVPDVEDVCAKASDAEAKVAIANYNTPVQVVISGSGSAVKKAAKLAEEAGAKRVIPLAVSCAFHSSLMQPAADGLATELAKIELKEGSCPLVSNIDAQLHTDIDQIKGNLIKQVSGSVQWIASVEKMLAEGVEIFVEFGPGKVVSGMIKKIFRKAKVLNIDKLEDVAKVVASLSQA